MIYQDYPELKAIESDINSAIALIEKCYEKGGKIMVAGNGGSASDSSHIVGELMKGFLKKRELSKAMTVKFSRFEEGEYLANHLQGALPAIDLTSSNAIISAFSNDVAPDMVYAQLLFGYAKENDVFIGLSTSGNSKNIVNALKVAKVLGIKTIAFTGSNDSKCSEIADITIKAPSTETYRVQEYHLPIYHHICIEIEKKFF